MAIIKCKMCGGDLEILEDSSVCECEYCGTKQTVPKVDDEKKLKLFERANRLRTACEFDKAAGVYETIIADFDQEAEAYWGLILCKFGIEYVDDPATGKKIPTCHRSSFESLMDDPNFEMVMECADPIARRVYRDEAKQIEELRKRIIEVSSKEEPYDVFISYKELAEDGQRTLDSVIAQDIYTELTDKGYRVFFSRISLDSKLGVEYEPYIFAALNSAKVMLVVGTDYDYFNAVWVKNEWSRFLALMAKGEKKVLIPVFKGIDAYDMPKEFNKLAAQDMGKVGAMQDLIRGVEKILGKKQEEPAPAQPQQVIVQQGGGPNVTALLDRGNMALEDGEWDNAKGYFDQVLNMDARNAEAYLGLAMAELRFPKREDFERAYSALDNDRIRENRHLSRAIQFGSGQFSAWIVSLNQKRENERQRFIREKGEQTLRAYRSAEALVKQDGDAESFFRAAEVYRSLGDCLDSKKKAAATEKEAKYRKASEMRQRATSPNDLFEAAKVYHDLGEYKDSSQLYVTLTDEAKQFAINIKYEEARSLMESTELSKLRQAEALFTELKNEKDSEAQLERCRQIKQEILYKNSLYSEALKNLSSLRYEEVKAAEKNLHAIQGWKDSEMLLVQCQDRLRKLEQAGPLLSQREKLQHALSGKLTSKQRKEIILQLTELDRKVKTIIH